MQTAPILGSNKITTKSVALPGKQFAAKSKHETRDKEQRILNEYRKQFSTDKISTKELIKLIQKL